MKNKSKRLRQEDLNTHFEEKVLYINRCSKSLKGRKFSFSASLSSEMVKSHRFVLLKPMKFPMLSVKAAKQLEKIL